LHNNKFVLKLKHGYKQGQWEAHDNGDFICLTLFGLGNSEIQAVVGSTQNDELGNPDLNRLRFLNPSDMFCKKCLKLTMEKIR